MITQRHYKILAFAIATICTSLVFIGRSLQDLIANNQMVFLALSLLLLAIITFKFKFFNKLLGNLKQTENLSTNLGLALLLSTIALHIGTNYVEYIHLPLYAGLSYSIYHGFNFTEKARYSILFTNCISLFDEFLQHLHPERVGDLRDILLNFLASCVGLLLIKLFSSKKYHAL